MSRLHHYVLPLIIAMFAATYAFQIAGQRYSVVLFPSAILVLIAVLLVLVIIEKRTNEEASFEIGSEKPAVMLIGMSLLYYFSLIYLGFDLSNLWFSLVGSLLMGIRLFRALFIAVATAVLLYGVSRAMDFNVPLPFWV